MRGCERGVRGSDGRDSAGAEGLAGPRTGGRASSGGCCRRSMGRRPDGEGSGTDVHIAFLWVTRERRSCTVRIAVFVMRSGVQERRRCVQRGCLSKISACQQLCHCRSVAQSSRLALRLP